MLEQPIDQLCYTRSSIGLSGTTEFQVRAASDGIADIYSTRFATFDKYLRYTLPNGTERSLATTETAPRCLAYVKDGTEHIVVHKVYSGRDSRGRPGVYFAHMLAGLPNTFSVRDAIDMWKSSFWLISEPQLIEYQNSPRSVKLPTVQPGTLEEKRRQEHEFIARYETSALKEEYLHFLMQIFVNPEEQRKIYIAGSDAQIATLIWGLVHSLPLTMLKGLTFSTYEHDLDDATMRIVGTCRPITSSEQRVSSFQQDLPQDYTTGRSLGLNCYTGESSKIALQPDLAPYISFAIDCLRYGKQNELEEFIAIAENIRIDDIESLLLLYRWNAKEDEFSPEDTIRILRHMKLAIFFLKKMSMQQTIINLAITDNEIWKKDGEKTITNLYAFYRHQVDTDAYKTLDTFVRRIIWEIANAIVDSKKEVRASLVRLLDATRNPTYWLDLLKVIEEMMASNPSQHPSEVYTWQGREWLVQRWAAGIQNISYQQIAPWLGCRSLDELIQLLAAPIPHQWHVQAIVLLLISPSVPPWLTQLVTNHYKILKDALLYVVEQTTTPQYALQFFVALVEQKVSSATKIDLLATLLRTKGQFDANQLLQWARLSSDDIAYVLGTELAIEFLTREYIQQIIIHLAITNDPSYNTAVFAAIEQLSIKIYKNKDSHSLTVMNHFCNVVITKTAGAIIAVSKDQKALLELLGIIAPPASNSEHWFQLFMRLSNEVSTNSSWDPSNIYRLDYRIWFLQQCIPCSQRIGDQQVFPWLKSTSWEGVAQILSAQPSLPHSWQAQGVAALLLLPGVPLSSETVQLAIDYHQVFNNALIDVIRQPEKSANAIDFFTHLIARKIPSNIKLEMLATLLFFEGNKSFNADYFLQKANFSPEEKKLFFKEYGQQLLNRSTGNITFDIQDVIIVYVLGVGYHDIVQDQTRELLRHIRKLSIQNAEIQQRLNDWYYIEEIISIQNDFFYAIRKDYILTVDTVIRRLHLYKQERFKEHLFNFIVHISWSDKETLQLAIEILAPALINLSVKEVSKAQRELLFQMVQSFSKHPVPYKKLIPYIMLSVTYYPGLKGNAKDNFIQILFEYLLKKANRKTFDNLDREAQEWPDEIRKGWQHYSASLRPKTLREAAISGIQKRFALFPRKPDEKASSSPDESEPQNTTPPPEDKQPEVEITEDWVKKVAEVKKLYIKYRLDVLGNKIKETDSKTDKLLDYFYKEHDKLVALNMLDDQQKWYEESREDIWTDKLIDYYLQALSDQWKQWLQETIQKENTEVFDNFKKYNKGAYRKQLNKKGTKDEEIKEVLLIFIRYYSLAIDHYNRSIELDKQLLPFREKYPLNKMEKSAQPNK